MLNSRRLRMNSGDLEYDVPQAETKRKTRFFIVLKELKTISSQLAIAHQESIYVVQ